jgi:nucleoside-diphosphate-sugar epimerase
MQLAQSPWPLPFGSFRNRRSLLSRQNLITAIHLALQIPAAIGETYLVADPIPLTPAEIIAALRAGQDRSPWLVPVPPALIAFALNGLHRADVWDRLGGEMVADPKKLLRAGWLPPVDTRAGLAAMVQATSPRKSGTASRSTR